MLTRNFATAKNAREPLEVSQDIGVENASDLGAQGNAFAGGRANHDHEMHNAIHGAIMNGDTGGNSSIANAGMRLAAKFGSAATKSEKDAEKNRAAYMQVMNQQLQVMRQALDDKIAESEKQREELDEAFARFKTGDFDPLNKDEDWALVQQHDPHMTRENWQALSLQDQEQWFETNIEAIDQRIASQKELRETLDNNPEMLEVVEGEFTDSDLLQSQQILADNDITIDPNALTSDDALHLSQALMQVRQESYNERAALETASDSHEKTVTAEIDNLMMGF